MTERRTVVLGVGNRMRGDDAVGCLVCDELKEFAGAVVFDGELAPENYIIPILDFGPSRVMIVDACDFGGKPGEFRLFSREDIDRLAGGLVSTHTLPLTMTAAMLDQQLDAEIVLLGIQPAAIEFGAGLSEPVSAALPRLVQSIRDWVGAGLA